MQKTYSTHDVGLHFGIAGWRVQRLCERGLLPEPTRVGRFRVFYASDLPRIEKALRAAGYLKTAQV